MITVNEILIFSMQKPNSLYSIEECHRKFYIHVLEHVYMGPEVNSNRFEISLRDRISLRCEVTSLSVSHAFGWSEIHFGANFTSVKLTKVRFQTAVSFPCKH